MDLPSSGRSVSLVLRVRHFRCANAVCPRKTFAEPLPNLLLPHAQRTSRLRESLRALGEVVGGEVGAQVSKRLGMACSADTVLRLVRHAALSASPAVKVLGVDEWAWRKGQSYGTMLVDLERHAPVDVLEDASADSFATWLKQHKSVQLITRDRAGTYADGAAKGAPKATQIADRWHLLGNLGTALEKVLARHHDTIKRAFSRQQEQHEQEHTPAVPAPVVISHAERIHQSRRDRRLARYQEVRKLHAQDWSFASIARMLGMNKKTVAKFAQAEQFPEARPRGDRRRKLTPYLSYLQSHWEAGEHNAARLYRAIHAQGFRGSETTVRAYLSELRDETEPRTGPRRHFPASSPATAMAAQRPLQSSGDLAHPGSAGEALAREAAPKGHRPRGASRSEHGVSAGASLRSGDPHQKCKGIRTLVRASHRQRDTGTGQFCRRDPTRPIGCVCRSHLSVESRTGGRANSSPEAAEEAILWSSGL